MIVRLILYTLRHQPSSEDCNLCFRRLEGTFFLLWNSLSGHTVRDVTCSPLISRPDVSNAFISHMRTSLWRSVFRRTDDQASPRSRSRSRSRSVWPAWMISRRHAGRSLLPLGFQACKPLVLWVALCCFTAIRLRQELTKCLSLPAEHFISRLMSMEWRCGLSSPASWYRTDLFRVLTDAFAMNAWMSIGSATSVMQENHQWMALGF